MKTHKNQLQNVYVSLKNKENDIARKIYLNGGLLSKSSRNQHNKAVQGTFKQLNFKRKISRLKQNTSHDTVSYSQRKNKERQNIMKRQSSLNERSFKQRSINFKSSTKHSNSSRLNSSTSRLSRLQKQKTQKSTMISELQNATIRLQKQKEDKKNHQQGKNCRIVIIQGTNQQEHYLTIDKIGDIMSYLSKQYPRYKYYKSIPNQLTIDYFLMEGKIDGKFLNGQSLYLKPCGRVNNYNSVNSNIEKQQVGLQSFQIIKLIGSGGFSKVFLCRFKQDGNFYAMKVIDKDIIVKNKKKKIIMNERNIMADSNHPFVVDLKFAFQSQKYLVFVMQYCAGGQLFGLIKKYRRIEENMARFYIIQIFLGLKYLHEKHVVYRDIKPQNILICQNGHAKIADLGLAKPNMDQQQLAYSFCGSPQYMSPQMILQVGHTFPVDYYCMGALLYQLLTGLPPYYSRDPNEIYQSVLSQDLTFPPDVFLTPQCKNLLKGLLCKQPKQRLGSIHGVKEILAHPWFGKNQYKKFIQKQAQPPINFSSIGKVNLDDYSNQQKNKKQVEQVRKEQKIQRKKFKQVMKGFYFDYQSTKNCQGNAVQSKSSQKNELIQNNTCRSIKRTEKSQTKRSKQLNFRRKSSSKKKMTQITQREDRKENNYSSKKRLINELEIGEKVLNLKTVQPQQSSTLKKLTTRTSRTNLFKHKFSSPNSNNATSPGSSNVFKNILNSERC